MKYFWYNTKKQMKSGENMLYDIDKTLELMSKTRKSREFCDLVYDVESYLIDLVYAENESIENINPVVQEKKGKAKVCEYIISEKENQRMRALLDPVMTELGIPKQIKGYRMLQDCIMIASREAVNNRPYYLMNVYPVLASEYNISVNNAEKLCRYACGSIQVGRLTVDNYPFLDVLARKQYENITLKETVDVLVKYVVSNCKLITKKR